MCDLVFCKLCDASSLLSGGEGSRSSAGQRRSAFFPQHSANESRKPSRIPLRVGFSFWITWQDVIGRDRINGKMGIWSQNLHLKRHARCQNVHGTDLCAAMHHPSQSSQHGGSPSSRARPVMQSSSAVSVTVRLLLVHHQSQQTICRTSHPNGHQSCLRQSSRYNPHLTSQTRLRAQQRGHRTILSLRQRPQFLASP